MKDLIASLQEAAAPSGWVVLQISKGKWGVVMDKYGSPPGLIQYGNKNLRPRVFRTEAGANRAAKKAKGDPKDRRAPFTVMPYAKYLEGPDA